MIDYVTDYARKAVRGDIIVSNKNIKSAKRHLRDLKRKDFEYEFIPERANKKIKFMEKLTDPKTGKKMKLAGFQKFIVGSKHGWVNEFGNRRFTKSFVSMSRKNGKTILISGESLYELYFGKNPSNERLVGLTANSRDQAGIAYDMAVAQTKEVKRDSNMLNDITKIRESTKEIFNVKDRSKIKGVSNEAGNVEGYQFSYAIIDEYHEAKNNKMYDALRRGQILLDDPILDIISTAGFNLNGPMYEEYEYISGILDGLYDNDNYFIFVAEQDSENEIYDENLWIKSNPLMEIPEMKQKILRNLRVEVAEGIEKNDLNGILVKNFNMWRASSKETYIKLMDWKQCYTAKDFNVSGREVYIGFDLSRRDDLTAIGFIYPLENEKYYVDSHVFVGHKGGIRAKSERDKIDYEKLVRTNYATLTDTESGIINDQQMFNWLIKYIEDNKLDVQGIMYDPWSASNLLVKFEGYNYRLIEVKQNYMNLSEPLKQFKLDVFEKKIFHSNNPNLNIAINNAIEKYDNNGNILLNKEKNREKIDPIIAVVTAFTQAMHHEHNKNLEAFIMSDEFEF